MHRLAFVITTGGVTVVLAVIAALVPDARWYRLPAWIVVAGALFLVLTVWGAHLQSQLRRNADLADEMNHAAAPALGRRLQRANQLDAAAALPALALMGLAVATAVVGFSETSEVRSHAAGVNIGNFLLQKSGGSEDRYAAQSFCFQMANAASNRGAGPWPLPNENEWVGPYATADQIHVGVVTDACFERLFTPSIGETRTPSADVEQSETPEKPRPVEPGPVTSAPEESPTTGATTGPGGESAVVDGFTSPSGNVVCEFAFDQSVGEAVTCLVRDQQWVDASGATECPADIGDGNLYLGAEGPAAMVCGFTGDWTTEWPTVEYGDTATVGPLECEVAREGVTCRNVNTDAAFMAAREAYEVV